MSALDLEAKRAAARLAKREQPKEHELRTYFGKLAIVDGAHVVDYERGSSAKYIDDNGTILRTERERRRVCPANVGEQILLLGPERAGVDAVAVAEILAIENDGMRVRIKRVDHGAGKVPIGPISVCRCSGLETL